MAAKRPTGLGKGLDILIPDKMERQGTSEKIKTVDVSAESSLAEFTLKINDIEPNREQPRKDFDEDSLLELSETIRQFGILQPLLVQKRADYYEIIAGERRWRAAKLAGLKEVPVIIKDYTPQEIVEISLIENIQRENLNPIEEGMAYKRLTEEFDMRQDEVAERVSKSRAEVSNRMRLLRLSGRIQQMIIDELISTGHARALLALEDEEEQYLLATRILDEGMSVRDIEKAIQQLKKPKKVKEKKRFEHSFVLVDVEERLKHVLGTKVKVNDRGEGKGKIEIEYYSEEELGRLYDMILSIK